MPSTDDRNVQSPAQPRPGDYAYDLNRALQAVVGLRAAVPGDAFTAEVLGTERAGHALHIREGGLFLTIGYLISEADQIWLHPADRQPLAGTVIAIDQVTGLGLVQALGRVDLPVLPLGDSDAVSLGDKVVVAGSGGCKRSIVAQVVGKQEFAGYWEYVLDEAIFTAPAHPNWGGTALIGASGELLGIGSLQLEANEGRDINMMVPINLLKPIFDDMLVSGGRKGPARPWLGMYVADTDGKLVVMALANRGPAQRAKVESGDIVVAVNGVSVESLADLFRNIWATGNAGVDVTLTLARHRRTLDVTVTSADRNTFLKTPRMH